jgi:rod shape determining protein RodA
MLLILFMGLIALSSASVGLKSYAVSPILLWQLLWVGLGLGVYAVCMFLPLRTLEDATPILYTLGIALLMAVLIIGDATKGSRRWIELGILNFQPSEMMKLLMVLVIAKVLQKKDPEEALGVRGLLGPLTLIFIPVTLIILEPDLGTALSVLFVSGSLLLFFGVRKRLLMGLLALSVAIIPLGWLGLKDYQRERLLTFIDPSKDPLGSGYHILQSKIAVGSGGLSGKGFFQGTQSKLQFLPEKHTDFIFSVLAEEWGFLGSMALLCAYAMLLYHGLSIARTAKGSFLSLVAVGVLIGLFFQVLTNVGMVMGLMPVVGIPLPLVSYGGTSILMTMASLGILQNIHRSSFVFYA